MEMIPVRFIGDFGFYKDGDIDEFTEVQVKKYIAEGYAEIYNHVDRKYYIILDKDFKKQVPHKDIFSEPTDCIKHGGGRAKHFTEHNFLFKTWSVHCDNFPEKPIPKFTEIEYDHTYNIIVNVETTIARAIVKKQNELVELLLKAVNAGGY